MQVDARQRRRGAFLAVTVTSTVGAGSRFALRLAAANEHTPERELAAAASGTEP